MPKPKQISNPFSTGSGGAFFEVKVQAAFVVLMLTGGIVPCIRTWPITKLKLQGKYAGFETDDFIVFTEDSETKRGAKLLAQVKHSIAFTDKNDVFSEVIAAAWSDFNNPKIFNPALDAIVLITGPLSATDISSVRFILEWARHCEDSKDFFTQVRTAKFSSDAKRKRLKAFQTKLKAANSGTALTNEEVWRFLRSYHVLGYDLDVKAGVTLSLVKSHLRQSSSTGVDGLWAMVFEEVSSYDQNAGTLTRDNLSAEILEAFEPPAARVEPLPEVIAPPPPPSPPGAVSPFDGPHADALMYASLLGAWSGKSNGDVQAIKTLLGDE
jgi:hypothetical protein